MTVETEISRSGPYAGAGTTGPFLVDYRILDATHLRVVKRLVGGVEVTLAYPADYLVTGVGDPTSSLTTSLAVLTGETLTIIRDVPKTQEADYVQNDDFPAETHENALDKLTMIVQQLAEEQDRALTLPVSAGGVSTELPIPQSNALIGWNAGADALQNVDPLTLATTVAYGTTKADLFSGTGVQTVFALTASPGVQANLDVAVGGVTQRPGIDYTWSADTTLTFTTAPPLGPNNVLARYQQGLPLGTTDSATSIFLQAGAGMVARSAQDKMRERVSAKDAGAVANGVTDDSAKVASANAQALAAGTPLVLQGVHHIAAPMTITAPIADTMAQIFSTTSQITIDNGLPVRPEWFGSAAGNIARAVNSLPFASGGTVLLASKTYPPSYNTATGAMLNNRGGTPGVDYMVRKHIRFDGDRLPEFNAGETALQNGTIIQGPLFIGCECDGFQVDNVGVDSGTTVVNALYGGVEQDGLCIVQTNKTVPLTGTQFQIGQVVGLCKIGSAGAHAVLVESVSGGSIGRAEGRRGYHGVAIKSRHMSIGALVGHGCGGEDVIIKGDTYAVCSELQIDSIATGGLTGVEAGVGVQIQGGTASVGSIQIGSIFTLRKDWGLVVVGSGNIIADVEVGQIISQSCAAGGMQLSGDCRRVRIGNAEFNASPNGLYVTGASSLSNHIDNLAVANCATGVFCDAKISIGDAHFDTVTTALSYSGGANINLSRYTGVAVTNFWNINPALAGTWVSHAGGDAFKATLDNGKVVLSGLIQSGAAGTLVSALAANIRPTQNYRFCCLGYNGAAWAPIEVVVTTTGVVSASNFAAASSYLSLSGVQWPAPF